MRTALLVALLALAGCEHISGEEVAGVAAAGLGAAAGTFAAHLATSPEPVAVPVEGEPDGGAVVVWPDAGGKGCATVADRTCCTPTALAHLAGWDRDAGAPDAGLESECARCRRLGWTSEAGCFGTRPGCEGSGQ